MNSVIKLEKKSTLGSNFVHKTITFFEMLRMFRIRRLHSIIKNHVRRASRTETTLADEYYHSMKILLPTGLGLYAGWYVFTVPVVGRSMSPQFNPQFADYGDTVLVAPRIIKSLPLKRGKVYIFNDPAKL